MSVHAPNGAPPVMSVDASHRSPGAPARPGLDRSQDTGDGARPVWRQPTAILTALAVGIALAAGVALRFLTASELWLDEALSVAIARLPVPELLDALAQDGHPPLYYLLLHGWMEVFGTSNVAVRALSGLLSCASLGAIFLVACRMGGRGVGWPALLLLASSPFAIRYATETRMYSLVVLLTLLGTLAVLRVLDGNRGRDLATLAALSGALALTHYWGLFLIGTTGGLLTVIAMRGWRRRDVVRAVLSLGAGLLLFLPWVPTFLAQLGTTGTPWAYPGQPSAVAAAIVAFAGDVDNYGVGVLLIFVALTGLAVFGRATGAAHAIELDLRTRAGGRELAVVVFGTLGLAIAAGLVTGSAYASRYAAVVLGPYLVLVALGVPVLRSAPLRNGALAAAVVLGLLGGAENVGAERTQAGDITEVIEERGQPGDVVVYCPDQLGPAHERLLSDDFRGVPFPTGGEPSRVDWRDYEERNLQADAYGFAEEVIEEADGATIWLVSAPGYLTYGQRCDWLTQSFQRLRVFEQHIVERDFHYYEPARLTRYPARFEPGIFRAQE